MQIVPAAHRYPGHSPVYRENKGPLLDLGAEIGHDGCAVFLSPREIADVVATRGVLEWPRVRAALEAHGWQSPEKVRDIEVAHNDRAAELNDLLDAALAERDHLLKTVEIVKAAAPEKPHTTTSKRQTTRA